MSLALLRTLDLGQQLLGTASGSEPVVVVKVRVLATRLSEPGRQAAISGETILVAEGQDLVGTPKKLIGDRAANARRPVITSHFLHQEQQGVVT